MNANKRYMFSSCVNQIAVHPVACYGGTSMDILSRIMVKGVRGFSNVMEIRYLCCIKGNCL